MRSPSMRRCCNCPRSFPRIKNYFLFMMSNVPRLTTIVLFPILASFLLPILPRNGNKIIRWYTLGICTLEFLLITYIFHSHFHFDSQSIQLLETSNWINSIHFHWRLGIDGLSMSLILLTGFITTLATLAAWPITRNTRLFYFSMLVTYSGQVGLFERHGQDDGQ